MHEYYGRRAREYEKIYFRDEPSRQAEQVLIAEAIKTVFQGKAVLEVACGTGYWTQFAAETAKSIIGIDIRPEVLDIARKTKMYKAPIAFCIADAFTVPFTNSFFDAGLANFWFSHLREEEIDTFLYNFHRVLQSGSTIFMADNMYNPGVGGDLVTYPNDVNTYKQRILEDGSKSLIVKNYPTVEELTTRFSKYSPSFNEGNIFNGKHFWHLQYQLGK